MKVEDAARAFFDALQRASMQDVDAAIFAFRTPEADSPMLLDADARALHDALVDLSRSVGSA